MKTEPITINDFLVGEASKLCSMRIIVLLFAVLFTTTMAWAGNIASRLEVCEGELNAILLRGYAYNVNQQSQSLWVYVDIYSDEACTSQYGESHSLKANVSRPDLNDRGINGDHGFEADIPIADAGIYYVKVYVQPSVLDDAEQINVPYSQVTVTEPRLVTLSGSESYTAQDGDVLTGSTSGTVTIADGASITLFDATINGGIICAGTAAITLAGTNSVRAPQYKAGIQVGGAGTTLTIRGDGALTATGGFDAAGIGLSRAREVDATGGDIVIESGTITANGGYDGGAGIGTGSAFKATATLGNITIKGGTVTANGGGDENALGIGTGFIYTNYNSHASFGAVTIYDNINYVEISKIWKAITYMHGDTDVTDCASDYFYIAADGSRRLISSKSGKDYAITIADDIEHGSLAGPATAKFLERVTMTVTPNEGYVFKQLIVKDSQGHDVAAEGTSFTMPHYNVTVSAVFSTLFFITIADGIEHGTITGPTNAEYGDRVTMTVTPDEGYSFLRLIVKDCHGNDVATEGTSFIMPQSDVTVSAVFVISNHYFVLAGSESHTAQDGDFLAGSTSGTLTIADGASITLSDATITGGIICAGTATITLAGTNSVRAPQYKAGIQVGGAGTTLTIRGDGSLTAIGGYQSAGIGLSRAWDADATGGNIVIEGGDITVTGGVQNPDYSDYWGAGIGTGVAYKATATLGDITIKGGAVTATGYNGIGTGAKYNNASSTIGAVTVYDNIDWVDASSISKAVTYMHGDTDVTDCTSDYFDFAADGSRRLISSKNGKGYAINIANDIEHGSLAGPATAKFLESVTLTATPDPGYGFRQLIVKDSRGHDVASKGTSFTMPHDNVIVSAEFTNSDFFINIADDLEHGTITGPTNAEYGDRVTMTVTPDEGYSLLRLIVKDFQGNDVASEGASFTMPLSNVTVSAEFYHNYDVNLNNYGNYTAWDGDALTGSTSGTVTILDGASITLRNVTIGRGIVCNGSATITLVGTNNVTVPASTKKAGIQVGKEGTTLTIRGNGSLTAKGGWGSAGIGLSKYSRNVTGGDIVIEGGTITATGGLFDPRMSDQYIFGAGIGLGMVDSESDAGVNVILGDIIIKGGTVTAIGSGFADGIGEGYINAYGTIQVGKVTVYDEAVMVDATSISKAVTFMHGNTDVTANPGDYFTITHNAYRYLIMPKGIAEEPVTIVDGTPFTQVRDHIVPSATYTKTLGEERVGKYQAWLVPFDYTITDADLEKFTFYKIQMIANAPAPGVNAASDDMWVFLTKLNAGDVLHGNMPYVYKPLLAVTDYEFTTAPVTVLGRNTGVTMKTETAEDIYSFYATYENTTATTADPFYYVGIDGNISYGDAVTVGPYRWIIRKTSKSGDTPQYARRMYFYDGESAEVSPSGISSATSAVRKGAEWYDLQGRRLTQKPTLPGVYVNNGKKVVIK